MPKHDDGAEPLLDPTTTATDEWEKAGLFAPSNRKRLGLVAGLVVVIGCAGAGAAVALSGGASDSPDQPVLPLAFAGGFFVDPHHTFAGNLLNGAPCPARAPGVSLPAPLPRAHERECQRWLAGTRMMAVELKGQAPPEHKWRGQPCCAGVREARGLVKRRETALLVSAHAINGTKDANDELIIEAEVPIHDLNLAFNNSRDEYDAVEAIYNRNVDIQEEKGDKYEQVRSECNQPQPTIDNCDQALADALAADMAANQTTVDSKQAMDAAHQQNIIDKEQLDAGKEKLKLAEVRFEALFCSRFRSFVARFRTLFRVTDSRPALPVQDHRDHDVTLCEEDQDKLLKEKQEAQVEFGTQRKECPGLCSGVPPPPPTREQHELSGLVVPSRSILTVSAVGNSGAWRRHKDGGLR